MHAGRFIGVAGTDVNLPALQQLAEELSRTLYKGEAGITLLSTNNQIIASGVYFFVVEDRESGKAANGKFVVIHFATSW